jgi:UDP-2,3-diacylglucosamine pyrophosphatase LpxH
MKEWSFSLWVKTKVKKAIQFINHFEEAVCRYAKEKNVTTVIAGHIHKAEDTMFDGIRYLNTGTYVEFCSYVVEYKDGTLELKFYE